MRKLMVVLVVGLSLCLVASFAVAGAPLKDGTVKSVDEKNGQVVLTVDGKEHTLHVDKGLHLGQLKPGDKVEFEMEKDMLKSIKAAEKPNQPKSWMKDK